MDIVERLEEFATSSSGEVKELAWEAWDQLREMRSEISTLKIRAELTSKLSETSRVLMLRMCDDIDALTKDRDEWRELALQYERVQP